MYYYSPSVKQNKNAKGKPWRATVYYKDPSDGKVKQKTRTFRLARGKKEAQQMARDWMDELNEYVKDIPSPQEKGNTIAEVIREYEDYRLRTGVIEKSTYKRDMLVTENYINPFLGEYYFNSLQRTDVTKWITDLYSSYSKTTVRNAYTQLKKVYTYYFELGEIDKNPFKGVDAPQTDKPKVTHLNKEQMEQVLTAVYEEYKPTDAMLCGILLAFYGGLRRGEVCGLRWRNIDFDKRTIEIDTSIGYGNGGNYTKGPKTKSSNRIFPMLPQLYDVLKARHDYINPKSNWFVIGRREKFMSLQSFTNNFQKLADKYDLKDNYKKRLTPHGLRHNFATVGINSGMDIASLSLMMGHASRAMTLDVYGDASADALRIASEKLAKEFGDGDKVSTQDKAEDIKTTLYTD